MDDERLVVEVEKYVELYDQSSRHYKDNSKKVIAWRAIALEIGSSGDFLHLYCSAAVAPPPVGARGVLLTRVKCAPCRCAGGVVRKNSLTKSVTDAEVTKHTIRWFNLAMDRATKETRRCPSPDMSSQP
ncbi:unnamed protein product [Boreogadus saida]